ncbi:MAG: ArnT family glycosyltransferase [Chthoniobacterales bacterium]
MFDIQKILHSIEQGKFSSLFRVGSLGAVVIILAVYYSVFEFNGFRDADAMDQAQIARSVAQGHGFTTQYIRPLAVQQLLKKGKPVSPFRIPDMSSQPLYPYLLAPFMKLASYLPEEYMKIPVGAMVSGTDRIIAALGVLLFLLSCIIFYFVAKKIFDHRVALIGSFVVLVTDLCWRFSISGLSQMFLLFLFALASWFTVGALEGHAKNKSYVKKLFLAAFCFGLMILTHGVTAWIFVGWIVFLGILMRQQMPIVMLIGIFVLLMQLPWMARNFMAFGNPFGLNIYLPFWSTGDPAEGFLRLLDINLRGRYGAVRSMFGQNVLSEFANLFKYFGLSVVCLFFFASLLHRFRSDVSGRFRWGIFAMWVAAFLGMAFFGIEDKAISTNQLHVLFIPLMAFYGSAFLIVLWSRLDIRGAFFRGVFLTGVVAVAAIPMLANLFIGGKPSVAWPPYVPPFIEVFSKWYNPDEILCSDMPWAVAWYAERTCVLLPEDPNTLVRYNDYRLLGNNIVGLYLTPITGNQPLVSEIYTGAYKKWARLITRPPETKGFFLPVYTQLPIRGDCILFADRERWK